MKDECDRTERSYSKQAYTQSLLWNTKIYHYFQSYLRSCICFNAPQLKLFMGGTKYLKNGGVS